MSYSSRYEGYSSKIQPVNRQGSTLTPLRNSTDTERSRQQPRGHQIYGNTSISSLIQQEPLSQSQRTQALTKTRDSSLPARAIEMSPGKNQTYAVWDDIVRDQAQLDKQQREQQLSDDRSRKQRYKYIIRL